MRPYAGCLVCPGNRSYFLVILLKKEGNDRPALEEVNTVVNVGPVCIKDPGENVMLLNASQSGPGSTEEYLEAFGPLLAEGRPAGLRFDLGKIGPADSEVKESHISRAKINRKDFLKVIASSQKKFLPKRFFIKAMAEIKAYDLGKYKQLRRIFKDLQVKIYAVQSAPKFEIIDKGNDISLKLVPPAIFIDPRKPAEFLFGYWRKDTQFGQKNVSIYISGRFVDYAKAKGHEEWVVAYLAHMLLEISGLRHGTAVELEIEIAGKNRQEEKNKSRLDDIFTMLVNEYNTKKAGLLKLIGDPQGPSASTRPGKTPPTQQQANKTLEQISVQGLAVGTLSAAVIADAAAELKRQGRQEAAELLGRMYDANQIHAPPVTGIFEDVFGLVYFVDGIVDESHLRIYISQDVVDHLPTIVHEAIEAQLRLEGLSAQEAHRQAEQLYAPQTTPIKRESGIIIEIDARALARTYGTISHVPSSFGILWLS